MDLAKELEQRATQLLAEHQGVGLAWGLLTPQGRSCGGLGVTSLEHPLPITAQTLFQWGSITKTFTATLIMRLVHDGLLDLDAPVQRHLPHFQLADAAVAARLTLRHLLTHSGGFRGDVFIDTGLGDDALARFLKLLVQEPQLTPLGEVFSYNNAGFCVAAGLVEAVTGRGFEVVLRERVLRPLELHHTYFFPHEMMTHRFALGHVQRGGQLVTARPMHITRNMAAAGGLSGSIEDLLRYAEFQLGHGGSELLSSAQLQTMQQPLMAVPGGEWVGLSWFMRDCRVYHNGSTSGQYALLTLFPEHGCALALLSNAVGGSALNAEVTHWFAREGLGLAPVQAESSPEHPPQSEVAGSYHIPGGPAGSAFELRWREGRIIFEAEPEEPDLDAVFASGDPTPPAPLTFKTPDHAEISSGPLRGYRLYFLRQADGTVCAASLSKRVFLRR